MDKIAKPIVVDSFFRDHKNVSYIVKDSKCKIQKSESLDELIEKFKNEKKETASINMEEER